MIAGLMLFSFALLLAIFVDGPVAAHRHAHPRRGGRRAGDADDAVTITSNVPENKRAPSISIWSAWPVAPSPASSSPGVLLQFFSRSPFIAFAAAASPPRSSALTIGTSKDADPGRFDWLGTVARPGRLPRGFRPVGGPDARLTNPVVVVALIGGLVLIAAFVFIELRAQSAAQRAVVHQPRFRWRVAVGTPAVLRTFAIFFPDPPAAAAGVRYSAPKVGSGPVPAAHRHGRLHWSATTWQCATTAEVRRRFRRPLAGLGILLMGLTTTRQLPGAGGILYSSRPPVSVWQRHRRRPRSCPTPLPTIRASARLSTTPPANGRRPSVSPLTGSIVAAGYGNLIGPTADAARSALGNRLPAATRGRRIVAKKGDQQFIGGCDKVAERHYRAGPHRVFGLSMRATCSSWPTRSAKAPMPPSSRQCRRHA